VAERRRRRGKSISHEFSAHSSRSRHSGISEVPKGKGATRTVSGCPRHSTSPFGTTSPTNNPLFVAFGLFQLRFQVLDAQHDLHLLFDLEHHAVVVLEEHLGVLTPLP